MVPSAIIVDVTEPVSDRVTAVPEIFVAPIAAPLAMSASTIVPLAIIVPVTVPTSACVTAVPEILVEAMAAAVLISALRIVPSAIMVLVTVPVSAAVTAVPVILAAAIEPASIVLVTVPVSLDLIKVALDGIVVPLMLVAVATPSVGVTRVGDVANTKEPVPVSSEITPRSSAEVVAVCCASVPLTWVLASRKSRPIAM
jgi:hypothetical protein